MHHSGGFSAAFISQDKQERFKLRPVGLAFSVWRLAFAAILSLIVKNHEAMQASASSIKQCSTCSEYKFLFQFGKDRSRLDGRKQQCKACQNAATVARVTKNPKRTLLKAMLRNAKQRSKELGLPCDIDFDHLQELYVDNCPIFNIALKWESRIGTGVTNKAYPNSPSLDRIDPERGYVKGNVWIISHKANAIKNNATHEQLRLVTNAVGKALVGSLNF